MVRQIEFSLPEYRYGFHLITSQIVSRLGELPETGKDDMPAHIKA
jgi:hypothetical protein